MKQVSLPSLAWDELHSPSRKFHSFCKNVSVALGARRRPGEPGEVHPFDLQLRRIPAGAAICPYHMHTTQWEMFIVLAGRGTVRANGERHAVETGDVFIHAPGTAHQTINPGSADLEVAIIANNPPSDVGFYPDSKKWWISPHRKWFSAHEVDYFHGEDEPATPPSAALLTHEPAAHPFKKINVEAVAWAAFDSPKKKFRGWSREISIALGAKHNTPLESGGHPFDLELQKLEPGQAGCPFHFHAAQWEMYWIVSGSALMRTSQGPVTLGPGDVMLHPPGEAHQIRNASATDDLLFYLIADNPPVDYWHYPDSGKWGLRAPRKFFRIAELDYWDGEE